jgi:hypothetical protein
MEAKRVHNRLKPSDSLEECASPAIQATLASGQAPHCPRRGAQKHVIAVLLHFRGLQRLICVVASHLFEAL